MIAAHKRLPQFAGTLGHLVRTGSVAHNVPEVHDRVERRSSGKRGVESVEVGVDVAEQQYAHESPDKLPIIDWIEEDRMEEM